MQKYNLINEPVHLDSAMVKQVQGAYNATWVCDTTLNGGKVSVFWNNEETQFPSRYFGIHLDWKKHTIAKASGVDESDLPGPEIVICDGSFAESLELSAIVADNNDVIYSTHRHDGRWSPDGSVMIDGGRDYMRTACNGEVRMVKLVCKDGQLAISE